MATGDPVAALASYRSGLGTVERLAAIDPTNTEWQRDLAVAHSRIGDCLVGRGDRPAALDSFRSALAIRERMASLEPDSARWQHEVLVNLLRIYALTDDPTDARRALRVGSAMQERGTLEVNDARMVDTLRKLIEP
jgi:hypothetical protein